MFRVYFIMYISHFFFCHHKVEHYTFRIAEKQQLVEENVEVDVEEQTVVFRVPQHNDLEAMEVINDFNSVNSISYSIIWIELWQKIQKYFSVIFLNPHFFLVYL